MVIVILDSGEPSRLGVYVGEDCSDRMSLSYYEVPPRIVDTVTDRIRIVVKDENIAYVMTLCDRKPIAENVEVLELSKLDDGEYMIFVEGEKKYVIYARKKGRYYLIMHVFDVIDKASKKRYLPIERTLLSHSEFSKISECLLQLELYGFISRDR